jgi:hypothetical protein
VLAGAIGWRLRASYPDDAPIALRYAHHVLAGEGWGHHPGEAINAATSPLHVLATAAAGACTGDLERSLPLVFALPLAGGQRSPSALRTRAPNGADRTGARPGSTP